MRTNALLSVIVASGLVAASSIVVAQNAAPARQTPRPQDVDPAVNTSATPPARDTPRPQDVEPRVNTSASPSDRAAEASSAAAGAAAPTTSSSTSATASGANPSRTTGAAPAQGAAAAAKPGAKGKALDRLELDTTQITGNRELPKVLYIVPWKRSDLGDLVGRPVNSLLDEVLTPVDRDVFQRENRYYRALTPGATENDALSGPDGRPAPVRKPPANSAPAAGGVSTGSGSAAPAPRDEK